LLENAVGRCNARGGDARSSSKPCVDVGVCSGIEQSKAGDSLKSALSKGMS
jgi:hypothetical protein